jgi:cell division protein FtsB
MELDMRNGVGIAEALIVAVAFAAGALLLGEEGLAERNRLSEKKTKLEAENRSLAVEIHRLERQVRLLSTDPVFVERAAKGRLGMARKDETVYVFSSANRAAGAERQGLAPEATGALQR